MSNPAEILLRSAGPADAPALARLGAATFTETFAHLYRAEDLAEFLQRAHSPDVYARLLADPDVAVWLATAADGEPMGYAVAGRCKLPVEALEAEAGEVRQLYVLARYQGSRLGTRLLVTALDWLRARGRRPVYVGVWSENYGAQRLYGRFGFEKIGEYGFPVGQHIDLEFILRQVRETPLTPA
jgi:ribosomal protein S18 acetylase RimI-like enzyme